MIGCIICGWLDPRIDLSALPYKCPQCGHLIGAGPGAKRCSDEEIAAALALTQEIRTRPIIVCKQSR